MRMRSIATIATCLVAVSVLLAGCGPKTAARSTGPTNGPATTAAAPTTPAVKDLTPGNCTLYTKDSASKLIGGVNFTNNALDINTDGGTAIDKCSYINLQGTSSIRGVSYAVVRFDSAATAFSEAQKVQTEMLSDANEHQWPVQGLTTPVPGAGQLLGGYGTKNDQGVTFTIAVVGTNVGPYLVAALGASTNDVSGAENYALSVFTALAAATS
jgi:hypothetical protein